MSSVNRDEALAAVAKILEEVLDRDIGPLSDGMTAADVPGWDSLNHLKIIVGVESALGIRFELDEFSAPKTVGEFIDLICRKMA